MQNIILFQKVSSQDIAQLSRQLATTLKSGIGLIQSFQILQNNNKNAKLNEIIVSTQKNLEMGKTLSQSFSQYPEYFDDIFINLVKAGEISGQLDVILNKIASFQEKNETLKRKVKSSLYYPSFVLVVILLLFNSILKDALGFSLLKLLFIFGVVFLAYDIFLDKKIIEKFKQTYILKIPVIGKIFKNLILGRINRTLSIMLEAGIPMNQALLPIAKITNNLSYKRAIMQALSNTLHGSTLHENLRNEFLFPHDMQQLIKTGETTGHLDEMCKKLADLYEEQADLQIHVLLNLLKPTLIVLLGILVGYSLIKTYLPIFHAADYLFS